jgi:hypothetical protein
LLLYLAGKALSDEAKDLKEYTVGIEALAKPESYDPRQDSSVRMNTGRLRQKLADYYHSEGVDDTIVVDLPRGGFKLTFETRSRRASTGTWKSLPSKWKMTVSGLAVATIIAIAMALYFGIGAPRKEVETHTALPPELAAIWEPILSTGRPVAVCLSVPIFVNLTGIDGVVGPFAADWNSLSGSRELENLKAKVQATAATPSYEYTDVATASGAFRLGQFLSGRATHVLLTRSDLMSAPEISMDNLIFIGSPSGGLQLQALTANPQFAFEPDGVRNLHPGPGEPILLSDHSTEGGFPATHALITLAPGSNGAGSLLYLTASTEAGIVAAVDAVTNPSVARKVFSKLVGADGRLPRYYQVVLTARSMEEMPIDISYAAYKPLVAGPSPLGQPAQ